MVAAKLCLSWVVVGGGAKLGLVVDARGWWWQNYGWLWMVVGGRGWSHDLIMPIRKSIRLYLLKTCFLYITPAK